MIKKYILLCLFVVSALSPKVIVWDLGDTLVKPNTLGVAGEIGWGNCIGAFFNGVGSAKYLRNTMYAILLQGSGCQQIESPELWVRDENGFVLPIIMADHWLTNKLTIAQILELADKYIEEWDKQKKFHNKAEKKMLKGIMRTVFSPDIVAKHTSIISSGLKLVRRCAEQGHQQYILSNWEKESFEALYTEKKNNKLFKYFPRNRITISGDCGMTKPHKEIFTYFIEKYNLNPADCIFIDNQPEMKVAAQACGLCAIHLKDGDYKTLEKELKALQAL